MDPNQGIMTGSCLGNSFDTRFQRMQSTRPGGTGGTGVVQMSYPYGVSPVKERPYGSSSVGRQPWDGWRYGSGYIGPNPGKVYGEPDYKYNKYNYCGSCGCGQPGCMGDPNGQNPNIRYVQLDPRNILGQGLVQQNSPDPTLQRLLPQKAQGDCPDLPTNPTQSTKFQITIGNPNESNPAAQPNQMISTTYGPGGDQDVTEGCGQPLPECNSTSIPTPAFNDPCGNCSACKSMPKSLGCPTVLSLVRRPQQSRQQQQQQRKCQGKGQTCQKYTCGPVLANVKKPACRTLLKK